MSQRVRYPAGVPCWADTLQPDPRAALDFYGALFGWEFEGPGPMPGYVGGEPQQPVPRDVVAVLDLGVVGQSRAPAGRM